MNIHTGPAAEPTRPGAGAGAARPPTALIASGGLLRRGDRGPAVATWQRQLNQAIHSGLAVDGVFGAATDAATRAFQRSRGIAADGVVGPRTRAEMARVLGL